jgi:hypothetical protein
LRGKVGERSDRIVAPDPPVKTARMDAGTSSSPQGDHRLRCLSGDSDITAPGRSAMHKRTLRRPTKRDEPASSVPEATTVRRTRTRPKEHHADSETTSSDQRRRRIYQGSDQCVRCFEPSAPQFRRKHGFYRLQLFGCIHPQVDLRGPDIGMTEP